MDKEFLEQEIKKVDGQIEILTRQIENSDRNITGLVAQKPTATEKQHHYRKRSTSRRIVS